jgi:hypothetical protein
MSEQEKPKRDHTVEDWWTIKLRSDLIESLVINECHLRGLLPLGIVRARTLTQSHKDLPLAKRSFEGGLIACEINEPLVQALPSSSAGLIIVNDYTSVFSNQDQQRFWELLAPEGHLFLWRAVHVQPYVPVFDVTRFRKVDQRTHFVKEWHKNKNIPHSTAHLISLKEK